MTTLDPERRRLIDLIPDWWQVIAAVACAIVLAADVRGAVRAQETDIAELRAEDVAAENERDRLRGDLAALTATLGRIEERQIAQGEMLRRVERQP